MAMVVKRQADGSETWNLNGTCKSAEIPFYVIDPTSKEAAIAAAIQAAPQTYGGLPLSNIRFDGYDGGGNINLVAVYDNDTTDNGGDDDEDEEPTVSFDCSGGTKHVVHAISQKRVYPEGSDDDAGGGIGWNGKSGSEAEFAGVDVPTANPRETYTKVMSYNTVTRTDYKRRMAALVGKVNSKKWKGWEAGEVMFLGCTYTTPVKSAKKVVVTFNFRISMNEDNCEVAGKDCGKKLGFEYMWARSTTKEDAETGKPMEEVQGIYNSTVCKTADFAQMGL